MAIKMTAADAIKEISTIMDAYTAFMYDPRQSKNDGGKQVMSAYYMGIIMGTLARTE
jgi:hypothetical protein